jgi:hypothetical protein
VELRPWKTAYERLRLWTADGTRNKTLAEAIVRDEDPEAAQEVLSDHAV